MKFRGIFVGILTLLIIVLLIYRFAFQPKKLEYTFYPMGGIPCRVVEYDSNENQFAEDIKLIEKKVDKLENVFNIHRPDSEVSELNSSPPNRWHDVSDTLYEVLEDSLKWYGMSGGAFDVTVEPLIKLWKRAEDENRPPSKDLISNVLQRVGSSKLLLSSDGKIKFKSEGMMLDFGGIAKGYILDQIGALLLSRDVDKFLVSCGGDVIMHGKEYFNVGIQDPADDRNLMMKINLSSGSVVTSGHYERYFKIGDERYSHIINPKTGYPVEDNLVSITVFADQAAHADALATAIAVLGVDDTINLLGKNDNYMAIMVYKEEKSDNYKIYLSKNLSDQVKFMTPWKNAEKVPF